MKPLKAQPILLKPNNFTPKTRTPWGGTRIVNVYKKFLLAGHEAPDAHQVGESWEVSVEPSFPSRCEENDALLSEVLAQHPQEFLGTEFARGRTSTALLVKMLDAVENLSVQIHPSNHYAGLTADESGKPEAWYVLERDQGAGLYIGLKAGVDAPEIQRALEQGLDIAPLLHFVPVEPGDFFVIEAGTVHAVGKGVTLIEPQHVVPGKKGVTYRFWDWNRRYDAKGQLSANGLPREHHVHDALAVLRWDRPRQADLLAQIRVRADQANLSGHLALESLCPHATLRTATDWPLGVDRLMGSGCMELAPHASLRSLTVVHGHVRLFSDGFDVQISQGRSAVLPACLPTIQAEGTEVHALLAYVR